MSTITVAKDTVFSLNVNGVKLNLTQQEAEALYKRLGESIGINQDEAKACKAPDKPIIEYTPVPYWYPSTSPWTVPPQYGSPITFTLDTRSS